MDPPSGSFYRTRRSLQTNNVVEEVLSSMPVTNNSGRRGRPRKNNSSTSSEFKITCISIPVTNEDDREVECKICCQKMCLRLFRVHNMKKHSNIATATDDPTIPEHKFYEKRLKEYAKFTKAKIFKCPVKGCTSSYKSCLGLAYHLETCGKTKEEIALCLIECTICAKKFTLPNMAWHKKTHHKPAGDNDEDEQSNNAVPQLPLLPRLKSRKSAVKARKKFLQEQLDEDEDELESSKSKKRKTNKRDSDYAPVDSFDIEFVGNSSKERSPRVSAASSKSDFTTNATAFITSRSNSSPESFWSRPQRISSDPLKTITENLLVQPAQEDVLEYLPRLKKSVVFKTIHESQELQEGTTSDFRQLPWFEGEVIDSQEGNLVFNAGGPILGLSWHPNGRILAVSTGREPFETIDYKIRQRRKSCIQIYSHHHKERKATLDPINFLTLQLIICSEYGYATHVQWCNFWPECWDSFCYDTATFSGNNELARIGHLAASFEDGTVRIFVISISYWDKPGTFLSGSNSNMIPVYKKSAELCLEVDTNVYPNAGQICNFEWHDDNKFVAVAYYGGIVAIFDVQTKSSLLMEVVKQDSETTIIINPFWCFQAHLGPITGINFDPMSSRYFITGSKDRHLKLWDLHLRQELESRKVGLVHDICWIRGWINVAVTVDAAISNLSSQYNFVRFYQLGTNQQRPNCAEFMDISSLSFHEGITIQGTEAGSITATYFDNFWRELDFDRNKKKHNVVNICKVSVDPSSFEMLSKDYCTQEDETSTFHFSFKEESPRVVFTFLKERAKSILPDPKPQFFEDYIRFLPFLRINKMKWSPLGGYFASGYRSGLLTIIPATFETLYN